MPEVDFPPLFTLGSDGHGSGWDRDFDPLYARRSGLGDGRWGPTLAPFH
jgi:hypothetical protein